MRKKSLEDIIKIDTQLKFLPDLIVMAQKFINPHRIILFGSRARLDHTKKSDVDLAFDIPENMNSRWSRFIAEAEENLKTLLKLDLLQIKSAHHKIIESIEKEGIIIYDSQNKN